MHPLRQVLATTPPPVASPPPASTTHAVAYAGPTGALFTLYFKNLLLSLATLGIYRFWAKTRLRQFLWGHTSIDGEPFEYTGTGKELFIGFLKALAILAPIFGALQIAELMMKEDDEIAALAFSGVRLLAVLVLIYAGSYAARRYRMSRTLWRGIRFEQTGSPWRYAGTALLGMLLTALTLGLYFPFMQTRLMRFEAENLRFGSKPFAFTGTGQALFKQYTLFWAAAVSGLLVPIVNGLRTGFESSSLTQKIIVIIVGGIIVLPILSAWYRARLYRFQAEHTRFDGLTFSYPALTGARLLWLTVSNWLLTIFSLTLLTPLVMQRSQRFWTRHLHIEGSVDFAAVAQAADGPRSGEGLAGFFNVDLS
jgi:uncharacterized membrane protein YjgN (DUF898 family)